MRNNVPPGYKTHALGVIPVQREHGFRECEHRFRKYPKSVHVEPEQVFTLNRNRCSRSTGIGVHVEPESAFTLKRNTQAAMDERHNTPNGLTLKKLCERACEVFGQAEYERLAGISVSHLYNRRQRHTVDKTRPVSLPIGERRKPQPAGQPGYIRIDTVHQGDLDGEKGVYHINAVDEVTQFEIVVSVERISEVYLIPALEYLLESFPFVILGFHADNGSEYINKQVARLLEKLRIELTKSRARHSNDNALVECKNGHVVRKLLGHAHIPRRWAGPLNDFHRQHLNPYVNYHRPCLFPETVTDRKGKQRKRYPYESLMTPYEKLKSLDNAQTCLKPGVSFDILDKVAYQISDNAAADALQQARRLLFTTIHEQEYKRA